MLYDDSILRLSRFAGANDQRNRELAELAADWLPHAIGTNPKPHEVVGRDEVLNGSVAFWDGEQLAPSVPDELKNIYAGLNFLLINVNDGEDSEDSDAGGHFQSFPDNINEVSVSVDVKLPPRATERGLANQWSRYCESHAASIFYLRRDTLIHEFTHAMDMTRYKDPKYLTKKIDQDKAGEENENWYEDPAKLSAYYNSPNEFNAYFQGNVARLEADIAANGLEQNGISSQRDMVDFVMNHAADWVNHLNQKYRQHLMKRLNQLYYDLKAKENQNG